MRLADIEQNCEFGLLLCVVQNAIATHNESPVYRRVFKEEVMVVITFHTTADAFAFEKACKQAKVEGRLTTIPRNISAGCGLAWSAPDTQHVVLEELINTKALCIEEVHQL